MSFITVEPKTDADKMRGHAMPFHADMIFQLNKTVINARFFESESQELSNCTDSDQKKTSPQHMIDVFMTPQSDEEFSEESMSP